MESLKVTLAQLAQNALDASNACNLSGVVISFARDIQSLRLLAREQGWDSSEKINSHPVSVLYSQAIGNITGSESGLAYSKAYEACKDMARSTPEYDTPNPATR